MGLFVFCRPPALMVYSHCTETGLGQVQGTGPAKQETMDLSSFPCDGPV